MKAFCFFISILTAANASPLLFSDNSGLLERSPDLDPGYGTMESIETIWVTVTQTIAGDSMCCISGASTAFTGISTPTFSSTSLVAFGTINAAGGKGSITVPSSALPSSSGILSLASTETSSTTQSISMESAAGDIGSTGTAVSSSDITCTETTENPSTTKATVTNSLNSGQGSTVGGPGSNTIDTTSVPSSTILSAVSTGGQSQNQNTTFLNPSGQGYGGIAGSGTVKSVLASSSSVFSTAPTGSSSQNLSTGSGNVMTSSNAVASSSIISTTGTCSDDFTANPSGVSSAGGTGYLTTGSKIDTSINSISTTLAGGQTQGSYEHSSLSSYLQSKTIIGGWAKLKTAEGSGTGSSTVENHKATKVMADIHSSTSSGSISSGGSGNSNPGGVPRLMVYVQTFHDVSGAPLSLLPLLYQKTRITHIIIAALHLMGPNNIHLNDNPPDDPLYDQLWNETKILQQNGVKVLAMMGGAATGSYIALSGTDELFNANYQPLRDNFIKKYNLDGLDLDIEEEVDISVPRRLLEALRTDMGDGFLRTMAPVASALDSKPNPQGGLSGFSYFDLDANTDSSGSLFPDPSGANLVSWYNVQFYSGFGDPSTPATYKSIIDQGWDPSRIVLGVLDSQNDGGGFVSIDKLDATIKSLRTMYTNFGGVIGWEYFDAGANDTSVDTAIKANEPWSWVKEIGNALYNMLASAKRALTSVRGGSAKDR